MTAASTRRTLHVEGFSHANPIPAACRKGPLLMSGLINGTDPATGPARVAQLYCGCPVPGSTPEEWHIVVSQWNTHDSAAGPAGWPYRSMQFTGSIPRPPGR